jgi:uncharacterized protein YndB with AHSA1/START domain
MKRIEKSILIHAAPSVVWDALTSPGIMKVWMAESEMRLDIQADWEVGGSIIIKGYHHKEFVNSGTVLHFDPPLRLTYTHSSSLSRLPDKPESHSILEFELTPQGEQIALRLTITNFATDSIFKHLDFYWTGTLAILKQHIESSISM